MLEQVWIGLVGVLPHPGSTVLGDAKGAFVNAVALVRGEPAFRDAVGTALFRLGLVAFEFEDIEPLSERTSDWSVDEELLDLARQVASVGGVRFGRFHNFRNVD